MFNRVFSLNEELGSAFYTKVINQIGYCRNKDKKKFAFEDMLYLYRAAQKSGKLDSGVRSAYIKSLFSLGYIDQAVIEFNKIDFPDVREYTNFLAAAGRANCFDLVESCYRNVHALGIADKSFHSSYIMALLFCKQFDYAQAQFHALVEKQSRETIAHVTSTFIHMLQNTKQPISIILSVFEKAEKLNAVTEEVMHAFNEATHGQYPEKTAGMRTTHMPYECHQSFFYSKPSIADNGLIAVDPMNDLQNIEWHPWEVMRKRMR